MRQAACGSSRRCARRAPSATTARAAPELGDEAVPISAYRSDVLDDLVTLGSRHALEDERRGVEGYTQRRRFVLAGHGGLDGLQARDELDPVPVLKQLVERMLPRSRALRSGTSDWRTCSVSIAIVAIGKP